MERRVLIVESQQDFALGMASVLRGAGYKTAMAQSAAEALRELKRRRPDLVILRAELPDQNGFNVCAQLKKGQPGPPLRVLLVSSDVGREGLARHAESPAAADGYLVIPFEMGELTRMAQDVLPQVPAQELEGALEDALLESANPHSTPGPPPLPLAGAPAGGPPKLPRRERRSAITEEDRSFLDRTFHSVADRKAELLAESRKLRRPVQRPELKGTPEGKVQQLRDELKLREAQVARIAEIWSVRERELLTVEDRLHDKDAEVQGLKMQLEDMQHRLWEAKATAERREREHGASIQELLEQKFVGEKEVIETVSAKEKELYVLRRELHQRDEELARVGTRLEDLRQAFGQLEKQLQAHLLESEVREKALEETVQAREQELAAARDALTRTEEHLSAALSARETREAELNGELSALQEALEQARAEREATVQREAAARTEQLEQANTRLKATVEDARRRLEELSQHAARLQSELNGAGHQLAARDAQLAALQVSSAQMEAEHKKARAQLEEVRTQLQEATRSAQAAQAEQRRASQELATRLQHAEQRLAQAGKEAQARAAEQDALLKEARAERVAHVTRAEELERALESGQAAHARVEKELGARALAAEAKASEAAARLAAALRERKDAEARMQREREELSAKHQAELERRDAVRAQEMGRLQAALQEKSKQLEVVELELQRSKTKPPDPLDVKGAHPLLSRPPSAPAESGAERPLPMAAPPHPRAEPSAMGPAPAGSPRAAPPLLLPLHTERIGGVPLPPAQSEDDAWAELLDTLEPDSN